FRRPERFEKFLLACEADARGRTGYENRYFAQGEFFRKAFRAASSVDVATLREQGFEHLALANRIREERIRLVKAVKKPE
ncbi:MAG: multifunctional CCA tRNA nucleotidyl transferase/2'3'-cyclic phosphodiesterase/2'nucleotidase/phosphatase, partial [Gammaproteobacteria bacterium]|nr:multifunctional CCA tRNA nucleotidyl transferase/2'3'-cyclic phosphodiesterase/2'nucleotidase/phosphatase [Gammaproteobacteria bacterium]